MRDLELQYRAAGSGETRRSLLAAAAVDGKIYTIGGYTTGVSDLVEAYDPAANT